MNYHFEGTLIAQSADTPYYYLPFTVPEGITCVRVSYTFSENSILDLGLLDPTAAPFPTRNGFRGWSGSARRSVFVALDEATPGYLPGELPAGEWQVILGLAKIASEGCDYSVDVTLETAPRQLKKPVSFSPAIKAEAGWYKGDLQSHTYYSDAKGSPEDLLQVARDRGLDFVAVTDHNTISHHPRLAELSTPELLLIPGEELTTYRGHANVWGADGFIDFRVAKDADLDTIIAEIHARGGLFSVNHPKAIPNCLGCDWEYPVPAGADSMEVWQGPWFLQNWESLARYDDLLKEGRRLTLVGGSDRHQPGYPDTDPEAVQLGSPTTVIYLPELSVAAVLAAIRQGHIYVTESPSGPHLRLTVGSAMMGESVAQHSAKATAQVTGAKGDKLCWVSGAGVIRETPITADVFTDSFHWSADEGYLRLEVVADASLPHITAELGRFANHPKFPRHLSPDAILAHPWRRALSNPVYSTPQTA